MDREDIEALHATSEKIAEVQARKAIEILEKYRAGFSDPPKKLFVEDKQEIKRQVSAVVKDTVKADTAAAITWYDRDRYKKTDEASPIYHSLYVDGQADLTDDICSKIFDYVQELGYYIDGAPHSDIIDDFKSFSLTSIQEIIARRLSKDRRVVKYARVPRGSYTCAWCTLLASRGWVYRSKKSAGATIASRYHSRCDCIVVPSWSDNAPLIDNYSPERMQEQVEYARQMLADKGNNNPTMPQIAESMRKDPTATYTDSRVNI